MRSTIITIFLLFGLAPGLWAQEQRSTAIQNQDLAWIESAASVQIRDRGATPNGAKAQG